LLHVFVAMTDDYQPSVIALRTLSCYA